MASTTGRLSSRGRAQADLRQKSGVTRAKPISRMRRESSGERVAVYLPPELALKLRMRCVQARRSVSDAVTEAVAQWLSDERKSRS